MTEMHASDDLDARARKGDVSSSAVICERARPGLERFACRYLGNVHEAEDVAQDAIAALLGAAEWPRGSATTWLYRAVRYRCLDARKSRRSAHAAAGGLFADLVLASSATGPRTAAAREETYAALREHIAALSDDHAEVVVLRYFEGMSRAEIADLLDLPEPVVKSRLYEAGRKLRSAWRDER